MATLVRVKDGKELILKIKPKRKSFSNVELISLLGLGYLPLQLMSGDILLITEFWNSNLHPINTLASKLAHQEIHGDAMIVETSELD